MDLLHYDFWGVLLPDTPLPAENQTFVCFLGPSLRRFRAGERSAPARCAFRYAGQRESDIFRTM
jgi:hypothetical protein